MYGDVEQTVVVNGKAVDDVYLPTNGRLPLYCLNSGTDT